MFSWTIWTLSWK